MSRPDEPTLDPARERILDAAVALIRGEGSDFPLAGLAERAAVSRSTLARRFRTRAALFEALARERGLEVVDQRNDHRERILRAAREVLGDGGPEAFTLDEVARRADVGAVTVYRHFHDRAGLMHAILGQPDAGIPMASLPASADLRADLSPVLRKALSFMIANPGLVRTYLSPEFQRSGLVGELRERYGGLRALLTRYLRAQDQARRVRAREPEALAHLLVVMILGTALLPRPGADDRPLDVDAACERILSVFLDGVRA